MSACLLFTVCSRADVLHCDESHTLHAPIKPKAPALLVPCQPISSLPSQPSAAWDHMISSGQSVASLTRLTSLTSCFPPAAELHFLLRVFVLKWRLTARPSRLAPDPTRRCWHALKRRPGWFWMLRAPTAPFSRWPSCTLEVRRLSYCVCVGRERRGRLLCHDLWLPLWKQKNVWHLGDTRRDTNLCFRFTLCRLHLKHFLAMHLCLDYMHSVHKSWHGSKRSLHVARVNVETLFTMRWLSRRGSV